jgi:hypothetical protein
MGRPGTGVGHGTGRPSGSGGGQGMTMPSARAVGGHHANNAVKSIKLKTAHVTRHSEERDAREI